VTRVLTLSAFAIAVVALLATPRIDAQAGRGAQPRPTAKAAAGLDLTGMWVSIVSEDWRYRMLTPQKGDYTSLPLAAEGRKVADTWDPAKDEAANEQCRSYGAAGLMRVPGRIRITWQDDETLRIDTEAGVQTRLFHFTGAAQPNTAATWQGYSSAQWVYAGPGRGVMGRRGHLKVVTTHLRPGYLRRNGVPYSADALLTEYYNRLDEPNGDSWLVVTTMVDDPRYLSARLATSTHFRKLPSSDTRWKPEPCSAR
jgi:hypothetical protein